MSGEGPSVPITTLAGIQSLTDLLLELPLPVALPGAHGNQSLLPHPRDGEEFQRLLSTHEAVLLPQLFDALSHASTDHVEVKDGYLGSTPQSGQASQLLQFVLSRNPTIFTGFLTQDVTAQGRPGSSHWGQPSFIAGSLYPQQSTYSSTTVVSQTSHSSSPQFPTQESPGYFAADPSHGLHHVQNSPLSVSHQKSPHSVYSPYGPPLTPQSSAHSNTVSPVHEQTNHLAALPEQNQQTCYPSSFTRNTSHVASASSYKNGNCQDAVNLISPVKGDKRTGNHVSEPHQQLSQSNFIPTPSENSHDKNTHSSLLRTNSQPHVSQTSSSAVSTKPKHQQDQMSQGNQDYSTKNCTPDPHLTSALERHVDSDRNNQLLNEDEKTKNEKDKQSCIKLQNSSQHNVDITSRVDKQTTPARIIHTSQPQTRKTAFNNKRLRAENLVGCENKEQESEASGKGYSISTAHNLSETKKQEVVGQQKLLSEPVVVISKLNTIETKEQESVAQQNSSPGPIVVLSKLSPAEQALAQKSVRAFTRKVTLKSEEESVPSRKFFKHPKRWESEDSDSQLVSPKRKQRQNYNQGEIKSSDRYKGQKRTYDSDEDWNDKSDQDYRYSTSLSERVKKRRRTSQQTTYSVDEREPESPPGLPPLTLKEKKTKVKKLKKEPLPEQLSVEELMETDTYQRFSRTVDTIFDSMEDLDLTAEIDEDAECPAEALIPKSQLTDLCNEAAKLKMLHAMNHFPPERLIRLLNILERNILDGAKLLPFQSMDEQDEEEARLWLELTMERIMRSVDSSLTTLYIMTSPNVPEKVFLEDVIERIVLFTKFQIQNTVYPVFDPAYRADPKSKDGYVGNIKQKRAHAHKVKEKSVIQLYNKIHELVGLLAELMEIQIFTDTIILHVSTLGVSPFFVERVSELQLNALRLVTSVFSKYEKHRQLILEDILASIARLPTSKRSLRNYRLNSEECIQMLTALVLQLIHSVSHLPEVEKKQEPYMFQDEIDNPKKNDQSKDTISVEKDVLIVTSYEAAVRTAVNFLSVFLKKCVTKNEEMDYRPLFENFVQDLLSTVNKPEWPASELLLSLLGRLLVQTFSNKSLDMSQRVASLDYLGVVAARLRKDAVTSQLKKETLEEIIKQIEMNSASEYIDSGCHGKSKKKTKSKIIKKDEIQVLQKALLDYLDENVESDPALQFARRFYIAQWYRDATAEVKPVRSPTKDKGELEQQQQEESPSKMNRGTSKTSRHRNKKVSNYTYDEDDDEEELPPDKDEPKPDPDKEDIQLKRLALAEDRKKFLLSLIQANNHGNSNINDEHLIDYDTAELISRFLASKRPFSQSFDIYLSQILRVLNETAVAVRTKAMKCLSLVVEADPGILARSDMQRGVHGRLLDQSTSVREAAVDLVGRFILIRPELTHKYYDMLTDRILDTGVSVRKRVIKILKDVCLEQPDFPKIPEICVKMIRRVNDEEGIKKLVGEVFQNMWFTPVSERQAHRIVQKVKNITHVVAACKEIGLEWFEQLLTNLLKNKEDSGYKAVLKSCKQIVDSVVDNVLELEGTLKGEESTGASQHLVACFNTLFLFSKIQPQLVVPHATTIQPYLSMRCNTQADYLVLQNVARTLELVVPLIEHPSESFLAQVEEDMVKLILRHGMLILPSCVSCLGSVVNRVTKNYQLVLDCFQKFFIVLLGFKKEHEKNPENPVLVQQRPKLLRSLFTVGLFCRHFVFESLEGTSVDSGGESIKLRVFNVMMYFAQHGDEDIRHKALSGLGFMMIRHYDLMLGVDVKNLYHYLLTSPGAPVNMKCQVLKNLTNYLLEEEAQMIQKDAEWSKVAKSEDLKEMGDITSGMASTVIQIYLKQVLESILHFQPSVRKAALHVVQLILGQGLVHPVQVVPYLICMGADNEQVIRTKADQLLQEIEKKYPGFVQMKALAGVRLSYKMLLLLMEDSKELIRGFRMGETPVSRNGFLYSVIRSTRQNRRAFVMSLLKLFDEQAKTPLSELLYVADNIVYFPYQTQDEPLFVIHHIDVMLSVSGSNLLQTFREHLLPGKNPPVISEDGETCFDDDEEDDDFESLYKRLPEDTTVLQECMTASQGCLLLLLIKQTLKDMYGFTDNKIQQYSPNESAKVYEKSMNRKTAVRFKPVSVIDFIKSGKQEGELNDKGRKKLVEQYLDFKKLMLTIDPSDEDDDNEISIGPRPLVAQTTTASGSAETKSLVVTEEGPVVSSSEQTRIGSLTPKSRPSLTNNRSRHKPKTIVKKEKKKKHKRKRKRIIESDNDSGSDPDYCE
ncbi:nipped-B-like protein A [Limulus polyphemus]|uniref:Nipped-B protein n=1 Tax=Limulus polyphemus TaxID=6850 RepID=A0ABM1C3Q0_LIMPO|nr:nipped-B-like protein A [Limulus polyphemus]